MKASEFAKSALTFYGNLLSAALLSLFPHTTIETFFVPKIGHKQYIRIERRWLGVQMEEQLFELADTLEKKEYLAELLKAGEITKKEYYKYLSPISDKRAKPITD